MANEDETRTLRVLCPKPIVLSKEPGLQWLIGSPFFTRFTLLSTFRCIHALPSSPSSPDFEKESDDLRMLIPKGFEIIGSTIVGPSGSDPEKVAVEAVDASRRVRELLRGEGDGGLELEGGSLIGAVAESSTDGVRFFVSVLGDSKRLRPVSSVIYEDHPERFLWERGCLVRCRLPLKLPVFLPVNGQPNVNEVYSNAIRTVADNFKDPHNVYIAEASNKSLEVPQLMIIYGAGLDFLTDLSQIKLSCGIAQDSSANSVSCSLFCSKTVPITSSSSLVENADIIHLTVLHNRSSKSSVCSVPVAGYIPAPEEAHLLVVEYELEVLCYATKDLPLTYALSKLVIPALVEQLNLMTNAKLPNLQTQLPQLHPYHFSPPGVLHPITVIYELSYGETELKQVELRRSLHMRLGLPFDRPLLRVANALSFSINDHSVKRDSIRKGSSLLKDVHIGIPSSQVSGGLASLVQGSYEYYHYLQDGFDDSGWGCAYRSLQTIVSWFKLQHYTSVDVPSHREIQQSLVEIGDKDPSFIGSREWIGAIELSFVLEKLAGVSCKVINVRSGAEIPEKCRELALHFESQGTPIMIGGGVLAYTLLGVDYSEVSGDCAFLILDPHYTGTDERKKIMSGGWCGWKKAIDSKGKNFFLHDKFYNLLLPQRPNMV